MAMTRKIVAVWDANSWAHMHENETAVMERTAKTQQLISLGRTDGRIETLSLDNGETANITYWLDENAAQEWKAWLMAYDAKYEMNLRSIMIHDIESAIEGASREV